ncbi:MAG TPA: ABC transporter permease [Candidatus Angelobacter sp.]|nr:ABC transporter permease [Candidatus Angelobacter sp.]
MPQLKGILRRLGRTPVFTAVTLVILAVGIGATTAIFSVVNSILLRPLPYSHPEELVEIRVTAPGLGVSVLTLSPESYFTFREENRVFQEIGLYDPGINAQGQSVNITGLDEPIRVPALPVTANVLSILRIAPLSGRFFTQEDEVPGSADTAILTYGFWLSHFGGRPVIGKTIDVDSKPHTIIGVLPQSFRFLDNTDLAILLPLKLEHAGPTINYWDFAGIARLKPGVTMAEANTDVARMLDILGRRLHPEPAGLERWNHARFGPRLQSLKQAVIGNVGNVLWIVMAGVGFLLLIACANLANLLLVRAEGRKDEMAIRAALGASSRRIAREFFLESLVLAVLGSLLGLGVAYGALRILIAVAPANLPRLNEIGIDGKAILFTLAVSVAALLLFGSAPALQYAGAGSGSGLREGGRSMSESRARKRLRGLLVVIQVALALVLLVSSGLMIRTFHALTRVNPGFVAPSEVQTFRVDIPETMVKNPVDVTRLEEAISHKLEAIPGVSSVGISRNLPMDGSLWGEPITLEGRIYGSGEIPPRARFGFLAPGFLKTQGTPLIAGREYTWNDIYNEPPVIMVSENFTRQYWANPADALGKKIRGVKDWREIIGVVGDVHLDGVDKEAPVSVYWPILTFEIDGNPAEGVRRRVAFAIRSQRTGSESFEKEIRSAVRSVSPNLPIFEMHTLNYYYAQSMAHTSFMLMILAVAAGMALFLGAVGLHGVIAYSVVLRRHEIGIRMALGAQKFDALKLVVGDGLILTFLGIGIGICAALGLTRFLSTLLYGVKPADPLTFTAVSFFIVAVAFFASYTPGRAAAKVDPAKTLRNG